MRRPKKKVYDYKKALQDKEKKNLVSKKLKVDMSPKDEVKAMFMDWFKKNKKINQIMSKENVVKEVLIKLDKRQNKVLELAMDELKNSGLVNMLEDGVTLVLTKRGFDSIE